MNLGGGLGLIMQSPLMLASFEVIYHFLPCSQNELRD